MTEVAKEEEEFKDSHNNFFTDLLKETVEGSIGMPIIKKFVAHLRMRKY